MKEVQVATEWGFELFFECPICTALVRDPKKHEQSHEASKEVGKAG